MIQYIYVSAIGVCQWRCDTGQATAEPPHIIPVLRLALVNLLQQNEAKQAARTL